MVCLNKQPFNLSILNAQRPLYFWLCNEFGVAVFSALTAEGVGAFPTSAGDAMVPCCCFAASSGALGAFAAGLILSKSAHTHAIEAAVKPVVALFATIFFVLIGTGMDLSVLNPLDPANRPGLIVAAFLLVVAIVGKVAAGWCFFSQQPTQRLVVGLGMMPRGEVGLIFLGLGTQAKLLSPALEAAILLMVIGTTFLAPILLRLVLAGKSDGPDLDPLAEIPT